MASKWLPARRPPAPRYSVQGDQKNQKKKKKKKKTRFFLVLCVVGSEFSLSVVPGGQLSAAVAEPLDSRHAAQTARAKFTWPSWPNRLSVTTVRRTQKIWLCQKKKKKSQSKAKKKKKKKNLFLSFLGFCCVHLLFVCAFVVAVYVCVCVCARVNEAQTDRGGAHHQRTHSRRRNHAATHRDGDAHEGGCGAQDRADG